ncbi:MAG: cupredoxin family protein [Pseudomonadota bacterium]
MKSALPLAAAVLLAVGGSAHAHGAAGRAAGADPQTLETLFGRSGDPSRVSRIVQIHMSDAMRYSPDAIAVRQGETIRFVVRNGGRIMHEMVLGTERELQEHARLMKKHPGMVHDAPYMAHIGPGQRAEIVWQFTQAGDFKFACLLPGHWEAGMVGTVRVLAR